MWNVLVEIKLPMVERFAYSTFIQHQKPCVPANLNKTLPTWQPLSKQNTTNITPLSQTKLYQHYTTVTANLAPSRSSFVLNFYNSHLSSADQKITSVWSVLIKNNPTEFLGEIAETRKATISFVMSVCPSVLPLETTRQPLDGFSWNFIFAYFSKICRDNSSFFTIWQE